MFRDDDAARRPTRLDMLIGKRSRKDDEPADILRKTAPSRATRRSLLEVLTPKFLSLQKLFEQADCHIKPSTLFGIGLLLALVGATVSCAGRACRSVLRAAQRPGAVRAAVAVAVEQAARAG